VLLAGLLITAGLSLLSATVNSKNESRLLFVQVREAGTVLASAVPQLETPLASGVAFADATHGDRAAFQQFMAPYIGVGHPFIDAVLCSVNGSEREQITAVGARPSETSVRPCQQLARATAARPMTIVGLVAGRQRLGYAYLPVASATSYGIYAESALPPEHRVAISKHSSFSNLNFALYLGKEPSKRELIEATVARLPMIGRQAAATVPFANTSLTLVGSPTQPLGGVLSRELTLIVSVIGVLLSLGAAALTDRLVRRRRNAELLADENSRLYAQQRSVAATLQRALLPEVVTHLEGVEFATRYIAGTEELEIGGDWFDIVPLDDSHFLFAVGDVSGRGVRAAIVMASLHYAMRAFASEGHSPDAILNGLVPLLDVVRDGHFATVLCGSVDIGKGRLVVASAGHPPPLLLANKAATLVDVPIGPPIGVGISRPYLTTTVTVPNGSTILAFTDGLFERRGETIDSGLERLVESAHGSTASLDGLLSDLVNNLIATEPTDDTAILGFRWMS